MTLLDYVVLFGAILSIAIYGVWATRGGGLDTYLKGDQRIGWGTIGLSVMATQASAITFLSTPGQGFESGLGFVQNYFGMPLALIIVAGVFLPIYRRLKVYTAYEYLGKRFDGKTRLLGAALFLLQRGLAAGITIYAPAIIVSSVLHWPLGLTVLGTGILVVIYTVTGGSEAVSLTQRYQMAVILLGMGIAFVVVLMKMPTGVSPDDALAVAGTMGKLNAVNWNFDLNERYTVWSGIFGGLFLSLSYFGTDQSQVQRYLTGRSLRESRMGLMFNAVLKIPMQFFILLLGVFVFVFYQFDRQPVFFNEAVWAQQRDGAQGATFVDIEERFISAQADKKSAIESFLAARESGDEATTEVARSNLLATQETSNAIRAEAKGALAAADAEIKASDADYVFITFVLDHLPHGLVGLLVAVIFCAALSSTASELNALGSTTMVDFYRHIWKPGADDAHSVTASKWFTAMWGAIAIAFALFANLVENLIEAVNILGSIFYGVVLGVFLVAFFLKHVRGTAVFFAALIAQALVIVFFFRLEISYLWYNFIGCGMVVGFSLLLQIFLPGNKPQPDSAAV
ncbi:sodium:solute symporter [Synoicihabitans lomoniglobus]|uniref:Sodium:solute symporter n=1 Tax=Synoicihabitans lomoniglobus TaxID=2909285 RepID=A0AAF0I2H4_9BACT|nr:sodium:solute symporter [Opitutaceae bacterium LMO-M01]WED66522.1 sodium:solute symporter [Opitutaceae bacterium LMO-M01]